MFERRSLKFPITLGVVMIVLLVVLIVGWILLSVFGAMRASEHATVYWTLLSVGAALFIVILGGTITYLVLFIKTINLNQRQSNFVDSVTHELKSPIASLKLYLQTMSKRQVSDEERDGFVRYMLDDVERLDGLISHLLKAGNVDRPVETVPLQTLSMDSLLREIVESVLVRYKIPEQAIELNLAPCKIQGRRVDLDMIFRNLIDNAVKYSASDPKVKLGMTCEGENVVVTVEDNGPGIPKAMRRKVFGRFVRLGSELERETPGTGLGLYIVKTLVARLGGNVKIRDQKRKSGTVFEVRLPDNMSGRNLKDARTLDSENPVELA